MDPNAEGHRQLSSSLPVPKLVWLDHDGMFLLKLSSLDSANACVYIITY